MGVESTHEILRILSPIFNADVKVAVESFVLIVSVFQGHFQFVGLFHVDALSGEMFGYLKLNIQGVSRFLLCQVIQGIPKLMDFIGMFHYY